jgi:hypothetical protein
MTVITRRLSARRLGAVVGVALALTAVFTTTASASTSVTVGAACGVRLDMGCTGAAQTAQVGAGPTEDIVYSCTATAPPVVENTVVSCYLVGLTDGRARGLISLAVPGNVATDATVMSVPVQGYKLCIGGGYLPASGVFVPVGGYACSTPLL